MNLKEQINQLNDIQDGFKNLFLSKIGLLEDSKIEEGLRRAAICSKCPLLSNETCNPNMEGIVVRSFTYYGKKFQKGDVNKGCGCAMKSKWLSSAAKCPLNAWSKELSVDEELS